MKHSSSNPLNPTTGGLGWDISFWFAVSSPLLGVLLAVLTLMIFFR